MSGGQGTHLDGAGDFLATRAAALFVTGRDHELALLDVLYSSAGVGLGFVDTDLRLRRVNDRLAAMSGMPPEAHIGRTLVEVLGPLGEQLTLLCRTVLDERRPVSHELEGQTAADPDVPHHWQLTYTPVVLDGRLLGVGAAVAEAKGHPRDDIALLALRRDCSSAPT